MINRAYLVIFICVHFIYISAQSEQQYQQQQYQQQQPPAVPPPQQQQQYQQQPHDPNFPPPPVHKFADNSEIQDQQHLKSHLEGQVNTNQQMTAEQMQFHYFKMHDTNNDNMLDGIELIKAITHFHADDKSAPPKVNEKELEDMIDQILKDDDFNNDGFIDYGEFLKAQAAQGAPAS